jgi:glutamyl-Q tRNA(Asp) synthetase
MRMITRFAPSPTGRLHLGHAYSALYAYKRSLEEHGTFILRIEDIDTTRCHKKFEEGIYEDLAWLGLKWEEPVRRQSEHMDEYEEILTQLQERHLLYPCFCTRKEILEEAGRSARAPHGPEGVPYPGTCKGLSPAQRQQKIDQGQPYALRLDLEKALEQVLSPLSWYDEIAGMQTATPEICGDVVLARKDIHASYHLCVTLDDHLQDITHIIRGEDLFYASHLHRLLQELLGYNTPCWHHHKLLTSEDGERLAKRDQSISLAYLREEENRSPQDIMDMIGLSL